jgi:hypothetical protein
MSNRHTNAKSPRWSAVASLGRKRADKSECMEILFIMRRTSEMGGIYGSGFKRQTNET